MKSLRTEFDTIVIGGGFGGLTAASLLAKSGSDILLLEGHTATGGCAGYFDRFEKDSKGERLRYRFDAGATTLSGVVPGRPFDLLFHELGGAPAVRQVDPGMVCHLQDGTRITRWSDTERWIAECERIFGTEGQRTFWHQILELTRRGWELSRLNPTFPPKSFGDIVRIARPVNLRNIGLLAATRRSVQDLIRECDLEQNVRFAQFIHEQLMITAQNVPDDTPLLVGAMGLAYPHETWYADGGMYGVARFIEDRIKEYGGEVRTKRSVKTIRRENNGWILETSRETYRARRLISNSTVWDMARLLPPKQNEYFQKLSKYSGEGWGAFTLYCAVQDSVDDLGTLYHQVHCDPLPYSDSASIFVSLSPSNDRNRAPEGWRTVTVSTHLPQPHEWRALASDNPNEYETRKNILKEHMFALMDDAIPGFSSAEKKFVLTGTPRTFGFYTRRMHGMVGGVPHTLKRNLFFAPKHRTPLPELYMVGDTVYPGQGVSAVVLGAMNLVREIAASTT